MLRNFLEIVKKEKSLDVIVNTKEEDVFEGAYPSTF